MQEKKLHGEAILTKVDVLPEGAKKKTPSSNELDGNGFIIAESETSGNHHCVALKEGVSIFEKEGTIFIDVQEAAKVYNSKGVLELSGHKSMTLESGVWQLGYALEYDPIQEMRRKVAD